MDQAKNRQWTNQRTDSGPINEQTVGPINEQTVAKKKQKQTVDQSTNRQ